MLDAGGEQPGGSRYCGSGMLELETAVASILAAVPGAQREEIPVASADGRVLADEWIAPLDLPPFDNSAMDGYALRSSDVWSATPAAPVRLGLSGRVAAGDTIPGTLSPGGCVRTFTGSPLVAGADAVVRQEDTRLATDGSGDILVLTPAPPGENVRFRGDDVARGTRLVDRGTVLNPSHLALLSACGVARVSVGRRPRVGVLASGSELREPGQPLALGQIYESNRLALAALVERAGGLAHPKPVVADSLADTMAALAEAFRECDAVVTCGGVSVGDLDFIKPAFEAIGGTVEFWQVAMRPGRPFVFGRWQGKLLFGLPGNPVSALVTFHLLVRPALRRWQGAAEVGLPTHLGRLAEDLRNPGDRRHFLRVLVDAEGLVRSAGAQGSHCLGSLTAANALLDIPPRTTLAAGTVVKVICGLMPD